MKTHFLFPNQFKIIGWFLFVPSLVISVLATVLNWNIDNYFTCKVFAIYNDGFFQNNSSAFFQIIENSLSDELLTFSLVIGGLLVGFSKLKKEDEMIGQIRYESLVWATYFNYVILLLCTAFMYGISFLNVLFYNTFSLLLFFIIRFHYSIYKLNKQNSNEE
ncbi:hypothetical protein [Flavobacterium sp.]|uniref:hypothetical protein n=1 Tax=Flavobacterium sp. TaxID=239 RepID=UPI003529A611